MNKTSGKFRRLTGVNDAKVISVIEVKSLAGEGTEEYPIEQITEYYTFDGELLARRDHATNLERGVWE